MADVWAYRQACFKHLVTGRIFQTGQQRARQLHSWLEKF